MAALVRLMVQVVLGFRDLGYRISGFRVVTIHVDKPMGLSLTPYSLPEHCTLRKKPLTFDGVGPSLLRAVVTTHVDNLVRLSLVPPSCAEHELSEKNSRPLTAYHSCGHAYKYNPKQALQVISVNCAKHNFYNS